MPIPASYYAKRHHRRIRHRLARAQRRRRRRVMRYRQNQVNAMLTKALAGGERHAVQHVFTLLARLGPRRYEEVVAELIRRAWRLGHVPKETYPAPRVTVGAPWQR